ncbi:MAG: NADPH-dependent oxidoreductase [Ardenticatenaceae bacterium]
MMSESYSTPVTDIQNRHASVRSFIDKPVPDEMVRAILNAARRSPTSSNWQSYSIIVVRDLEKRKQLAVLAGNQQHIVECQVFVAFCADIQRLKMACAMHGIEPAKGLELSLVATVDAALVGMSTQTAAESFGLGAVMIGGMRNWPKQVAEVLDLPSGVYVVYGMSIGWPDPDQISPSLKPRLPEELVIHYEQYDDSDPRPKMTEYNDALATYYGAQDRNQHHAAWTGPIANKLKQQRRKHLRNTLEEMGFRFD